METEYSKAWRKFTQTAEFRTAVDPQTIGAEPKQQRFIENRLRIAFDAGWNAKVSSLLVVINDWAKRSNPDA